MFTKGHGHARTDERERRPEAKPEKTDRPDERERATRSQAQMAEKTHCNQRKWSTLINQAQKAQRLTATKRKWSARQAFYNTYVPKYVSHDVARTLL